MIYKKSKLNKNSGKISRRIAIKDSKVQNINLTNPDSTTFEVPEKDYLEATIIYQKVIENNVRLDFNLKENSRLKLLLLIRNSIKLKLQVQINLLGKGSELEFFSLSEASGLDLINLNFLVNHLAPEQKSFQNYRNILQKKSKVNLRAVISIGKLAYGTKARLTNKNFIVDSQARVSVSPELEIHNPEVRCSHGSASLILDPSQLFYLKSRGMTEMESQKILIESFKQEILTQVHPICLIS